MCSVFNFRPKYSPDAVLVSSYSRCKCDHRISWLLTCKSVTAQLTAVLRQSLNFLDIILSACHLNLQ
jgi:hypothetical protein